MPDHPAKVPSLALAFSLDLCSAYCGLVSYAEALEEKFQKSNDRFFRKPWLSKVASTKTNKNKKRTPLLITNFS